MEKTGALLMTSVSKNSSPSAMRLEAQTDLSAGFSGKLKYFVFSVSKCKKYRADDTEKTIKEYVNLFVRETLKNSQSDMSTGAFS